MHALVLAVLLGAGAPAPLKIASMPMAAGSDVDEKTAATISEAVTAELRRLPGAAVITREEIRTLLEFQKARLLLGCDTAECTAELGAALGVDHIVSGSVGRLGESWLVQLKSQSQAHPETIVQSDRRIRGGTVDDVLDVLPELVGELFPGAPPLPPGRTRRPGAAAAPPQPRPVPWAEKPLDLGNVLQSLEVVTDGKGLFLAFKRDGGLDGPLLAGDRTRLFAQRIGGGGSEDSGKKAFDFVFWEPRVKERWRGSFDFKGGAFTLLCGENKVALAAVPAKEAKALLSSASVFSPRWQRRAFAIARDDDARYFYVDCAREPDEPTDCRLFVGTKGAMEHVPLADSIVDSSGALFISKSGKLRIAPGAASAEWTVGKAVTKLVPIDLWLAAPLVYTTLGVYAGEKLGTPCDERL